MPYVEKAKDVNGSSFPHTCPDCHRDVVFHPIGKDLEISQKYKCGQRCCPNCKAHIFVVFEWDRFSHAYPPILINFDSSEIPEPIVKTFKEALSCHGQKCFVAAAIMVRRTLEEICSDRGAQGKDLKARISDLRSKIVLPEDLFAAMDELRLLGNDAAHIEAKSFEDIGQEELETAILFTKEILKSVYQYKSLLTKLRNLKQKGEN